DLKRDAARGLFDVVILIQLDRLSRRLSNGASMLDELEEYGIKIHSAAEGFHDISNTSSMILMSTALTIAQNESSTTSARVHEDKGKRAQYSWTGGPAPYGFKVDKNEERVKCVSDPDEAAVILQCYDMLLRQDKSRADVAKALEEQGVKTRKGNPWRITTLSRTLVNPVLVGWNPYDPRPRKDVGKRSPADRPVALDESGHPLVIHEPIVTVAEFEKMKELLYSPSRRLGPRSGRGNSPILSGLIFCESCGSKLVASYSSRISKKNGEKTVYRSYSCPRRSSGICPNGISESVERYIHSVVTAALKGTQFREALAKAQKKKRKEEAQKAHSVTAENLRSLRELKDVYMSQYRKASDPEVATTSFNRIAELNEEINRLVSNSE